MVAPKVGVEYFSKLSTSMYSGCIYLWNQGALGFPASQLPSNMHETPRTSHLKVYFCPELVAEDWMWSGSQSNISFLFMSWGNERTYREISVVPLNAWLRISSNPFPYSLLKREERRFRIERNGLESHILPPVMFIAKIIIGIHMS